MYLGCEVIWNFICFMIPVLGVLMDKSILSNWLKKKNELVVGYVKTCVSRFCDLEYY